MLGNRAASFEIGDLPIVSASMRSTFNFAKMRQAMRSVHFRIGKWRPKPGSGWELAYRLARTNWVMMVSQMLLAAVTAVLFYAPALFLQLLIRYLEADPERKDRGWGWVYAVGLFSSNAIVHIGKSPFILIRTPIYIFAATGQLWSLAVSMLLPRLKIQLNTILFAKTLIRKDVASSTGSSSSAETASQPKAGSGETPEKQDDEDSFSSKAQVMTLMTTDVDRVSEFSWHLFSLVGMSSLSCFHTHPVPCYSTAPFLPRRTY